MQRDHLSVLNSKGFTLIELAIVLIIFGLLMAAFLMPLSAQLDAKNYRESRNQLDEAKEALVGFALSHSATDGRPYLPCPDTDNDGIENRTGSGCTNGVGTLPTQDLGVLGQDAWTHSLIYAVSPQFSNTAVGFTLASAGNLSVLVASGGGNLVTGVPAIVVSKGKNGNVVSADIDEQENADNDQIFVSHDISTSYDDIVIWLSSNVLFNKMVAAGRLP